MYLISSVTKFYNSKLFFSKNELTKILECYSKGVSNGKWKDYAIISRKQEAIFCMFRHSMASPECILTKTNKYKIGNDIAISIDVAANELYHNDNYFINDKKYSLVDLNSTNGTFVNGQKISEMPIKAGDKVQIGKVNINVK